MSVSTMKSKPLIRCNIPKRFGVKDSVLRTIDSLPEIEYSESFFNGNLLNCDYDQLQLGDFSKLLGFLNKDYGIEDDVTLFEKMHDLFSEIIAVTHKIPILIRGINEMFYLADGNDCMMAYKVLGISPVVKVVNVPKEIFNGSY